MDAPFRITDHLLGESIGYWLILLKKGQSIMFFFAFSLKTYWTQIGVTCDLGRPNAHVTSLDYPEMLPGLVYDLVDLIVHYFIDTPSSL